MKRILVFGGSNSKESINKKLAIYTAKKLNNVTLDIIDLNDFELPIYSIDLEKASGIPVKAKDFYNLITQSSGIVISLAEHNGAYSTAFKNIFDWVSRIDGKLWQQKPMLLMAASPGGRGGASVLAIASDRFPRMGANIVATFSLPFFQDNFNDDGITNTQLEQQLNEAVTIFSENI